MFSLQREKFTEMKSTVPFDGRPEGTKREQKWNTFVAAIVMMLASCPGSEIYCKENDIFDTGLQMQYKRVYI